MANGNGQLNSKMAWEWFWRFLSIIVIPWAFFVTDMLMDTKDDLSTLKTEVEIIKANRFTSKDGLELWRAMEQKANKSEVPPTWFKEEFDKLHEDFEQHKIRTRDEELAK